jgi:hypothetical protein
MDELGIGIWFPAQAENVFPTASRQIIETPLSISLHNAAVKQKDNFVSERNPLLRSI